MGRPPIGNSAMSAAERKRRQRERHERRATPTDNSTAAQLAEHDAEIATLRALLAERDTLLQARDAEIAKLKAERRADEGDAIAHLEARIVRMACANNELNAKLVKLRARSNKGVISRGAFNKLLRCLHTDTARSATDEELNQAFRLVNGLEWLIAEPKKAKL